MPNHEEIQSQLTSLNGIDRAFAANEIKELPKILWEDECVEQLIRGAYNNSNGLLVATNKRLIFIDKKLFGLKVEDFPYDKITSIQYETGLMSGEITIFASGNRAEIKYLDKTRTRIFAESVRARVTAASSNVSVKPGAILTTADDVVSKLERLASLKSQGILTEDEFIEQKRRLLSSPQ